MVPLWRSSFCMPDTDEKKSTTKGKFVLGPDGKPCRTCTSLSDLKRSAKVFGAGSALATTATGANLTRGLVTECPADLESLGRATWTFLHTTAAYYPTQPSRTHQMNMVNLLNSLPTLYPCHVCADHLKEEVKQNPPEKAVSSREGVMKWLCERHNEVNGRLGKQLWKCTVPELDERWKDGPADGSCD